jgi:hypothetical protein
MTTRRRLYIGPTTKNLIDPPSRSENSLNRLNINTNEDLSHNERPNNNINENERSNDINEGVNEELLNNINSVSDDHIDETITSSFSSTIQMDCRASDHFRKNLLRSLRNQYQVNEYATINIHLTDLESSTEFLYYWSRDVPIEDLLKNPSISLNDE